MALDTISLPFGLRDVKISPLSGETPGTAVDFPNSRTLSFSEAEDFEELRGDDGVVSVHGKGASVNWSLEGGGTPFEAIKTMYGGTITTTGTTPNQVKTFQKKQTDVRPYFRVEGQSISDSGGDFHVVLYRCRATGELSGELADGAFWLTGASGRAIGRASDQVIYDFVQNESETSIEANLSNDEVQRLVVDATGGTYDMTHASADIDDITGISATASVSALQALMDVAAGADEIIVSGEAGDYLLTYSGPTFAGTNVAQFVTDSTNLTGGSQTASVHTVHAGG